MKSRISQEILLLVITFWAILFAKGSFVQLIIRNKNMTSPTVHFDRVSFFSAVTGAAVGALSSIAVTMPVCNTIADSLKGACHEAFANMTTQQETIKGCSQIITYVSTRCQALSTLDSTAAVVFAIVGAIITPIIVNNMLSCSSRCYPRNYSELA